jgi:hypothetical protein
MHPGTPFDIIYPLTLKGTDERTDTIMGVRDTGIRPGICMALRVAFQQLNKWYISSAFLQLRANPQASFPYQRWISINGERVDIVYKGTLIPGLRKPLFLATRQDTGKEIVIKFTSQYGVDVHQELANHGMAPDIYGHMTVGGMSMVAMEYSEGDWWPDCPTAQQKENLQAIAAKMKSDGFVHGDLRAPNILVRGDRVVLINFDWAGREGIVIYPIHLSQEETWHPNACVGCLIDHSHDSFMIERLCR